MPRRARLVALVLLAAGLFGAWMLLMPHSPAGLHRLVGEAGPLGPIAFVAVWAVATPSLVSGTLLAGAAGLMFGPVVGTAVTIVGATVGGAIAFGLARRLGGDALGGLGGRAGRMAAAVERNGFRSVLCLRAAPGVPATVLNYAAGLSRVRLRDFALASAIGGAPRGLAYTLLGATAAQPQAWALALPVAILVVMGVVGAVLARATFVRPAPAG